MDVARERIIEKEVETVLRGSHADQVNWLSGKLGVELRKDLSIWPEFVELFERRNLLTHTGGAVSSQYINACAAHGVKLDGVSVGDVLGADREYFSRAVDVIQEFGSKLVQVIWRKLLPDEIDEADRELGNFGYRLIALQRYKLAATVLRFGLYEMKKHGKEAIRKQMVVNYANAEKLGGDKDRANGVLDSEDWSASTDNYRICVAAIKDDTDTVVRLMKTVVDSRLMKAEDFRDWPVFEVIRSNPKFIEEFERAFHEKFLVTREVTATPKVKEAEAGSSTTSGAVDEDSGGETTVH